MAGLMIHDNLKAYGVNPDDIVTSDNGRLTVPGIDFNISHSGDYVIMGISDTKKSDGRSARIGCDIEQIRDRNTNLAKRYFALSELEWIDKCEDKTKAFYQIWTARESYSKMTGEGILLDFKKYRVDMNDMGVSAIYRDNKKQDCIINQWLLDNDYIISVCVEKDVNQR